MFSHVAGTSPIWRIVAELRAFPSAAPPPPQHDHHLVVQRQRCSRNRILGMGLFLSGGLDMGVAGRRGSGGRISNKNIANGRWLTFRIGAIRNGDGSAILMKIWLQSCSQKQIDCLSRLDLARRYALPGTPSYATGAAARLLR